MTTIKREVHYGLVPITPIYDKNGLFIGYANKLYSPRKRKEVRHGNQSTKQVKKK